MPGALVGVAPERQGNEHCTYMTGAFELKPAANSAGRDFAICRFKPSHDDG